MFFTAKAPPMLPLVISYRIRDAIVQGEKWETGQKTSLTLISIFFFLFSFVRTTTRGRAECIEAMVARGHQSWRNLFRIITPRLAHFKKQFFMHESSVF